MISQLSTAQSLDRAGRTVVLALVLALSSACGDSSGADPATSGVQFQFSGDRAGQFAVEPSTDAGGVAASLLAGRSVVLYRTWSLGTPDAWVELIALRPAGNGLMDMFHIFTSGLTGQRQLATAGGGVLLSFGLPIADTLSYPLPDASTYLLAEGTVTIDDISADEFHASFSATGAGGGPAGGPISVTNGVLRLGAANRGTLSEMLCSFANRC